MNITAEIYNMIRSAKKGLAVFLGACICLSFISSAWGLTFEERCTAKFSPCLIQGDRAEVQKYGGVVNYSNQVLYTAEKQKALKEGCINVLPVEGNITYVSEEACLRKGTSKHGKTYKLNGQNYREHQGMDVAVPKGTPITAAADGVIIRTGWVSGAGNTVSMKHKKAGSEKDCFVTKYFHLSEYDKNATNNEGLGTIIPKGTTIGYVGKTGCDTGPKPCGFHLHIEIRDDPGCKGNEWGKIYQPGCAAINGLCDKNTPITAPPLPPAGYSDNSGGIEATTKSKATITKCGKLLPENDLTALHQRSESTNNPASHGCYATGCSFGLSGMSCPAQTMHKYLRTMPKDLFAKLQIGSGVESTIAAACTTPPSEAFVKKWEALAGSDRDSFIKSQKDFILREFGMILNQDMLEPGAKGITMEQLQQRAPEIQMALLSARIASGPAGPRKMINFMFGQKGPLHGKQLSDVSDKEFLEAYYTVFHHLWDNAKDLKDIKKGIMNREANEKELTLTSLAIREEMAGGKSLEDASQAVTGLPPCKDGEFPGINVTTVAFGSSGNYAGGYIGSYDENGDHECNAKSYRNSFKGCIFCDVFGVLYNTASTLAKKAHNVLAEGVIGLVCVGFALWLGMTILPFVAAMDNKGNPGFLVKMILNKAFLILCIVLMLRMDSAAFFRLTIEPLFNTGFKLAQLTVAGEGGETCKNLYNILTEDNGAGLPSSMGISILCTIETIQGKLLDIMSIGSTSFCVGLYIASWHNLPFLPHVGYLLVGVILWIAALMFMIIYPFLLIDSVLQLCVATALLPAAIGAFAFDWSKKHAKKMWNVFLNCMFNFIFLSLIIFILTNGLNEIVTDIIKDDLLDVGGSSDYRTILQTIGWWSVNFIKLVFYLILGYSVLYEVNSFAGKFAGGLKLGIGEYVGGLAANVAHKTSFGALSLGTQATSKVAKMGGSLIADKYNNFRTNRRIRRVENSGKATIDENGNRVLERRTITGRRVTETLQTNPDGTQSLTRQKGARFGFGGNKAVSTDQYIKNKKRFDKDGNLIREEMSMTFAAGRTLLHSDGTRNEVAVHAIRAGSGMSNDDVDKAIMNQMMKERMSGVEGADMNQEFKSRTTSRSVDASGREVFTVTQTNKDGSTSIYQMTKGDKRDMLTYTRINQKGKAVSYSSDGIINKKSTYKVDAEGNVDARSVKNNYAFAKGHRSEHYQSMDSNGMLHSNIPVDEIMMSQEDMALFKEQIATYGKDQAMGEFNK